ncbi:hypothetical protein ACTFIZ_001311 [Dictyostelium cf. discoideum]
MNKSFQDLKLTNCRIFLSAGLDGHKDNPTNCLKSNEEDYFVIIKMIKTVAFKYVKVESDNSNGLGCRESNSNSSNSTDSSSLTKLYINGFLRGQILAYYPKSNSILDLVLLMQHPSSVISNLLVRNFDEVPLEEIFFLYPMVQIISVV